MPELTECVQPEDNNYLDDIGKIFDCTMSAAEVIERCNALSQGEKYHLLTSHFTPTSDYTFPPEKRGDCYRSFKISWMSNYPWLVYSPKLDGAFCKHCALFAKKRLHLGALVNFPFRRWHKMSETFPAHAKMDYHRKAIQKSEMFCAVIEKPSQSTRNLIDAKLSENVTKNRHIVKCMSEALLFCARQCISLRGDKEDVNSTSGNPGNFFSLLKLIASHDPILKQHLESPDMKCVTYTSHRTQNELIEIIGKHIILRDILSEIREAKFYSIMADEVTSHNKEQLSLCVRFVDSKRDIREEFLEFSEPCRTTGEAVATNILQSLEQMNLEVTLIRGQSYDGAASMSSERVGLQRRIREHSPLATYVHCSSHCLNLTISHSCALPVIRNMMNKMHEVCLFFLRSPKRENTLCSFVSHGIEDESKRKPLLDLCRTRWAERHTAYSHFYTAFIWIIKTFEMIAHGLNAEECDPVYVEGWDNHTKQQASSLLASLTSFDFIITFVTVYHFLAPLSGITIKLQSSSLDLVQALDMVL